MTTFKELGLSDNTLKVLAELGFETPTDIQKKAIPRLLSEDKDMIGLAQTGTGKTAAFGLPLLERIDIQDDFTQGLILAPTRELGKQIAEQLEIFGKYHDKLNILCVYGGAAITNQIKALKKTRHVIIATPGRLIDLIKRKSIKLNRLKYIILDEADEMLNMGFKEDLDEILSYTPDDKLTWLFSATMPSTIKKIVKKYMDEPIDIRIDSKNEVNSNIEHLYTIVRQRDKSEALSRFLDIHANMRGVVFCRTKRETQDLAELLLQRNYKSDALHGDLSQHQRDRVMKRFKKHELQVLIATDVAARGIDVNDLTHVFHHTLPDDHSYYTHRSGRTARAGKKGTSIAFVTAKEKYRIDQLERRLGIKVEQVLVPGNQAIKEIRLINWATDLLESESKTEIEPEILEHINMLFATMSKEELINKLAGVELDRLGLGRDSDLNDTSKPDKSGRPSKRRKDGRRDGRRRDDRGRGGRGGRRSDDKKKSKGKNKKRGSRFAKSEDGGKKGGGKSRFSKKKSEKKKG